MNPLICVTLFILPSVTLAFPEPSQTYESEIVLHDDVYRLLWTVRDDVITFEAQVRTLGWIGLGLSTNGNMAGADVITAWVTEKGKVHLQDRHATEQALPPVDKSQDYQAFWGAEINGFTVIKFRRRLRTCDPDDMDIKFGTVRLIYAWHSKDPVDERSLPKHEHRASKSLNLIGQEKQHIQLPNNARELRFVINNYHVPAQTTTYYCSYHALPKLNAKHHIVKMETQVQPGNEDIVHHLVVEWCDITVDPDLVDGRGLECDTYKNNTLFRDIHARCNKMFYVWAIGGKEFVFPDDTGVSIGDTDSPTSFFIEVHYDNAKLEKDRYDSSAFAITITPTLRSKDSNLIMMPRSNLILPARIDNLVVYGICKLDLCLEWWRLQPEITIYGAMLHTHLAGRRIRLRHFRNGRELPVIIEELHYDSAFQQIYHLERDPVTVNMTTDMLVVECQYNTSDRTHTTYGDLSTYGEMCMAFLYVYPSDTFMKCGNSITTEDQLEVIGITEFLNNGTITSPENFAGKSWQDVVDEANWKDAELVRMFQDRMTNTTHRLRCDKVDFITNYTQDWSAAMTSYKPPVVQCTPVKLSDVTEAPPDYIKPVVVECQTEKVLNTANEIVGRFALAYVLVIRIVNVI